jgi:hypothetical protein
VAKRTPAGSGLSTVGERTFIRVALMPEYAGVRLLRMKLRFAKLDRRNGDERNERVS